MKIRALVSGLLMVCLSAAAQNKINGYLSFSYLKGEARSTAPESTFRDAAFGLALSGDLMTNLGYVAEARIEHQGRIEIIQALAGFTPSEALQLRAGMFLVPFGKFNQDHRAHQTLHVNPPLSVETLYPHAWRDLGVQAVGVFSGLSYSLYYGNGLAEGSRLSGGQQFQDNNSNKCFGGRLAWIPDPGLEGGYSYYRGKIDAGNQRLQILQNADLTWKGEGFLIYGEITRARVDNPEEFSRGEAEGFFVQGAMELGLFQPVVSYQKLRYSDAFHGLGFGGADSPGLGIDENRRRWALGLVVRPSKTFLLKLEYDFNRETSVEFPNDLLICQAALSF